jgi:hypothetical protein
MRSRALPPDFDNTRALRSQYGALPSPLSAPVSSLGCLPTFADQSSVRPLTLETTRRMPEYDNYSQMYPSPTGASPALGPFAFTPPGSEHISPDSGPSISPFLDQQHSLGESVRRHGIAMPPRSHVYSQNSLYRLPFQTRLGPSNGDTPDPPLRSSISHSGLQSFSGGSQFVPERSSSFSEHNSQDLQRSYAQRLIGNSNPIEQQPYGLAFPRKYICLLKVRSSYSPQHRISTE